MILWNISPSECNSLFKNKDVEAIEELIDVDTFIKFFLIQELFKNVDVGYYSVKMYKEAGGKLVMGPIWDFDLTFGNGYFVDYQPEGIYAEYNNLLFNYFMNVGVYKERFIEVYNENVYEIQTFIVNLLNETYNNYYNAFNRNFVRWDVLDKYVYPNTEELVSLHTIELQIEYIIEYLDLRIAFLTSHYNS